MHPPGVVGVLELAWLWVRVSLQLGEAGGVGALSTVSLERRNR